MKHSFSSSKLLLAAAIVLSLLGLMLGSFYIKSSDNFPIRQLLHEPFSPVSSISSKEVAKRFTRTESVSFRALQPDGSLEIRHIDVDVATRVDDRNAGAKELVVKPRHNLRPTRQLQNKDENDDDPSEDLGFYRKVRLICATCIDEI